MKKMPGITKGVVVHSPRIPSPFSFCRRMALLCLLAALTVTLPAFASEALAGDKENPKATQKKAAGKSAKKETKPAAKSGKKSSSAKSTAKPMAKAAPAQNAKNSSSKKSAKGKNSRKRLYVRSMLPADEQASLRERGIYSGFGPRAGSRKGKYVRLHKGIDVSAPMGASVLAFNDGEVIFAGRDKSYGISLVILQPDGRKARYAHMQGMFAELGDKVVRGQKIGIVGRTGRTTGPHLHFELIEDDEHVDPSLHVWDSTELVLRPGELDLNEMPDEEHLASAPDHSARPTLR